MLGVRGSDEEETPIRRRDLNAQPLRPGSVIDYLTFWFNGKEKMVWESHVGLKPHFDTSRSRVLSKLLFSLTLSSLVYKTRILSLTGLWSMAVRIPPTSFCVWISRTAAPMHAPQFPHLRSTTCLKGEG